MACGSCQQRALAALAAENTASVYLSCLRASLGIGPGTWDEDAHVALYNHLASLVDAQGDWRMTPEEIRAIPFGANPARTVFYASRYPTRYLVAGDAFWSCIGVTQAEAREQVSAESGPYWTTVLTAANRISKAEAPASDLDGGLKSDPLVPLAIGGAAFLLLVVGSAMAGK